MANGGKQFEADFKDSIPKDVYCLRLTDSAIGFDVAASTQRFAPKSPYDYVLYKKPMMYALELKSIGTTALSFEGKTPTIKPHQLKNLRKAALHCVAGFIINFRKSNNTYFLSIQAFDEITNYGMFGKKSISELDIVKSGKAVIIPSRIKKVRSSYDLSELFKLAI